MSRSWTLTRTALLAVTTGKLCFRSGQAWQYVHSSHAGWQPTAGVGAATVAVALFVAMAVTQAVDCAATVHFRAFIRVAVQNTDAAMMVGLNQSKASPGYHILGLTLAAKLLEKMIMTKTSASIGWIDSTCHLVS